MAEYLHRALLAPQGAPLDTLPPNAERRRGREEQRLEPRGVRRTAQHLDARAHATFLHLYRRHGDVQRPRRPQSLRGVRQMLRRHVVQVGRQRHQRVDHISCAPAPAPVAVQSVQIGHDQVITIETEIHRLHRAQAPREHRRARHQHQRHGDLSGDEPHAESRTMRDGARLGTQCG